MPPTLRLGNRRGLWHRDPMRRTLAGIGLVLLAVAAVGLTWWRAQRPVEVRLAHPEVATARWAAYVDLVRARPVPDSDASRAVLDAFIALNRAEYAAQRAGTPDAPPVAVARAALVEAQVRYDQARGAADLVQLGRWQGMRLTEHLSDLARAAARARVSPVAWVAAHGDDPVARAAIDVGGPLLSQLSQGGFLGEGGLDPARLPLLQAVFIQRWITPIRRRRPLDAHLSGDELEWLMRWRVEHDRQGRLADRVKAADALAQIPGYPAQLNAGVLLYRAGRYADAAARFKRSEARRAATYLRAARAQLKHTP